MLSTTTKQMLALMLVSAASATATGCAEEGDRGLERDPAVGHVIQPIIGGAADGTAHDSVVVLGTFADGKRMALCSATLVAPNLIVTARHCVSNTDATTACAEDGTPVSGGAIYGSRVAASLAIFVGKGGVSPDSNVEGNAAAHGSKVIVDSSKNVCNHDVAFVLLDKDVDAPVAAIRMGAPAMSEPVTAVGWGVDASGNLTSERHARSLSLFGIGPAPYPGNPAWGYGDREFMTGEGPCSGDSGGPAFSPSGALVGIAARTGNGKAGDGNYATPCKGADAHTVYEQIGQFQSLVDASFKLAEHAMWAEGTPSPYVTVQNTSSGASGNASSGSGNGGGGAGSSGSSGTNTDPNAPPVMAESAPGVGGDDPAPESAAESNAGGGCSMSSGDGAPDNVMYAAGLVTLLAFAFGLRRRFRRDDSAEPTELPRSIREPYESVREPYESLL